MLFRSEVRDTDTGATVEPGITTTDYLQGLMRGTRDALTDNARQSITITVPSLTPYTLGMLIALYERTVGIYASFVHINAYHQPGVEAGKKAAADFLHLLTQIRDFVEKKPSTPHTADTVATAIDTQQIETAYHILCHLATTNPNYRHTVGKTAQEDTFFFAGD